MLEIRGIWHCHMSRWDRYVLRPRIWMEKSRSGTVPHIGPYNAKLKGPSTQILESQRIALAYHSSPIKLESPDTNLAELVSSKVYTIEGLENQYHQLTAELTQRVR